MKKVLIAYFSQGGATLSITEQILKGMEDKQFHVDLYNMADAQPPDIRNYDMLGIGSPVYIFRPPFIVTKYIKSLPNLNDLPFFIFILYGTKPGTMGTQLHNALSLKGGKQIGYSKFKGADFFLGYLQRGVLFSPDNPKKDEKINAYEFGQKMTTALFDDEYIKPEQDTNPGIIYTIENLVTKKFLVNYIYTWFFKVDREQCNSCKICIKKCPNNNITLDQDDIPQWGHNCLFCLYCEMKCPKDAIRSVMDWPIMAPFMNYNVHEGKKNPLIEHVQVIHNNGKTKRI